MFRRFVKFAIAFAGLFILAFSHASALTQEQINSILNMLRAFGAEESVVMQVSATLKGESYSSVATSSSRSARPASGYTQNQNSAQQNYVSFNCPNISRVLYKGVKGQDVRELQEFLKRLGHYSYPEITGYYGVVTENAVKSFQASYGIVSYGTPASTGYGMVGPSTRAKIRSLCGADKIVKNFFVTPDAGSTPFVSAVSFSYKGANCTSFSIDWGDGSEPIVQYPQSKSCDSLTVKKTAKHTYIKKGEFTITLRISQNGKTETYTHTVYSDKPVAKHFDIKPTQGEAPLLVGVSFALPDNECSAYKIEWGDGTENSKEKTKDNCEDNNVKLYSFTHSYNNPGRYEFRLKMGQDNIENLQTIEQREINVTSPGGYSSDSQSARQTSISVSPLVGTGPLLVSVRMQGEGESCTSYEIDWGDGTSKQVYSASDNQNCSGAFHKEFTHSYFIPGTYTLKVKAGQTDLRTIPYEYHYITVK